MSGRSLYPSLSLLSAALLIAGWHAPDSVAQSTVPAPNDDSCQMDAGDRQWLNGTLGSWKMVVRDYLKEKPRPLPRIVTYDARCIYTIAPDASVPVRWAAYVHRGKLELPNGATFKGESAAEARAFAISGDDAHFVVMSLPSLFRPVAPKSEIPMEWFLEGILFHELTHDYQFVVTPQTTLMGMFSRGVMLPGLDDDTVQEKYKSNPAYVRDYEAERDVLFRAVAAPSDRDARALACEALGLLRARRTRHFTGPDAAWVLTDEASLTMEGLALWTTYAWLTRAHQLPPSLVISKMRSDSWSQEQGLGTFLLVNRLVPNWQKLAFAAKPMTAEPLLAKACGR